MGGHRRRPPPPGLATNSRAAYSDAMQRVGLLRGCCAQVWKSVRMASSGAVRRDLLANKVALVTASTDG